MEKEKYRDKAALQKNKAVLCLPGAKPPGGKEKLYSFGLYKHDVEKLISRMMKRTTWMKNVMLLCMPVENSG